MNKILDSPIVIGLMAVALTIYGPRLSPRLPDSVRNAFNNSYFRFFVILLIIFIGTRDIRLSFVVAILFVTMMSIANVQNMREDFDNAVVEYFAMNGMTDKVAPTNKMKRDIVEYFENGDLLQYVDKKKAPSGAEVDASRESIQGLIEHFEGVSENVESLKEEDKKEEEPISVSAD